MKKLTKISLSLVCIMMSMISTSCFAGGKEDVLMGRDGLVFFRIKTTSGKEVVTKYLSIYGSEVKGQSVLSKEETDRLLVNTSTRRHIVNVIPKESVVLYNLLELLNKYNIDQAFRSFSVSINGENVDDGAEVVVSKEIVHSVTADTKTRTILVFTRDYFIRAPLTAKDTILK